jgi:zinc protease
VLASRPRFRLRARLALAVAALVGPVGYARAQDSTLTHFIRHSHLDNGLDMLVVENHAVPLATVLVAVRNGAFTQDSAEEGLAHLYEHLLFRSYHGRPDAFGVEVTYLNGVYNAATEAEVVYYYVTVPSKNAERALKLVAQLVEEARFSKGDLQDERPVVLDELKRNASDPEEDLIRRVDRMLWGASWSRKDVGGDSASLAGITLDRLKDVYARYYVPNNAALIVTGDVSSNQVFERAAKEFGDWKRGPDPFADRPVPPVTPRAVSGAIVLAHDVQDVTIRIALPGPGVGWDAAATYAADVLFEVLNNPGSAFQRRLVDLGLFQSISGSYVTLNHTGPIEFVGKTTDAGAQRALRALFDELDNLDALDGISAEDLAIAKKHREVARALSVEETAVWAPGLASWWASAGIDYYLGYVRHMSSQTVEDLRDFARTYITNQPRVIGVLVPPNLTQSLAASLREGKRTAP